MDGQMDGCSGGWINDTKVFSKKSDDQDCENLQVDLNRLIQWTNDWQLQFNALKCKVMHLGNANNQFKYCMSTNGENMELQKSELEKDLGVMFDPSLTFSQH